MVCEGINCPQLTLNSCYSILNLTVLKIETAHSECINWQAHSIPLHGVIAHLPFDKINPKRRLTLGGSCVYTCDIAAFIALSKRLEHTTLQLCFMQIETKVFCYNLSPMQECHYVAFILILLMNLYGYRFYTILLQFV